MFLDRNRTQTLAHRPNVVKTKKGTEENGLFERLSWFDVFTFDVDGEVDVFTSMSTLSVTLTTTLQRKELSFWSA